MPSQVFASEYEARDWCRKVGGSIEMVHSPRPWKVVWGEAPAPAPAPEPTPEPLSELPEADIDLSEWSDEE